MSNMLAPENMPNREGFFGEYGGAFVPPQLQGVLEEITAAYYAIKVDPDFIKDMKYYARHYVGRPSPLYFVENLSRNIGGAKIYLKREDLNHTGAHKINHCIGEALLAKKMGKTKILAETGAGQHGVALATAAALFGLECEIHMGEVDIAKEYPNVVRMKILGATVVPVTHGLKTLKEAVDSAFTAYLQDPVTQLYAIGSVVGPHPFPMMVRDFQQIVGEEVKEQFRELTGKNLPDNLVACVGGGSNAMGLFTAFLQDESVNIYGVEPAGRGLDKIGDHAATLTKGRPGMIHGFKCYTLQDENGDPAPVYSCASGLDYPGIGPQHSYLKDLKRVTYEAITDNEAIDAFFRLSREEGIIPAIESAHAVAYAIKLAGKLSRDQTIVVNLSGRGDKDIDYVIENYGLEYGVK